jgi:hypothetical protein
MAKADASKSFFVDNLLRLSQLESPHMQAFLSIIAVLGIGTIVGGLISWRIAISNHRQAWINALRDDLSTFLKELEVMHDALRSLLAAKTDDGTLEQKKSEARIGVLFTYWRIILRLNQTEQTHVELKQKLDDLLIVSNPVPDRAKINDAVNLARRILKREWDVTKYGIFLRPILRVKHWFGR